MSEAEIKRRFDYKQNRNKWIRILSLILALVSLLTVLFIITYYNTSKNYYINYTEDSTVDYKVFLKENDFYDEDILGKDQMYVASLIEKVAADFKYVLHMEEAVNYSYSYKVNAVLTIADRVSGTPIYHPVYELVPETLVEIDVAQQQLVIEKQVEIDYDTYNEMAHLFIDAYGLEEVSSSVVLQMEIDVISACESFEEENSRNEYTVSLTVPLTKQKVDIHMESSVPEAETKILACTANASKTLFFVLSVVSSIIDALFIAFFIGFIFLTRNTDINYEIKVNKIVSAYKSYIQQIVNPFDDTGFQILLVKSFTEMLEIRDTIQSPILMNENADKTCTRFIIPTNTKLLYVFEIKVDNYDELYATDFDESAEEDIIEDTAEEAIILVDDVNKEDLAEAIIAPSIPLADIDYDADDDEELDEGVEVIGVVWPERPTHNKVYRYDPNGENVENGDIVLVPSRDEARNRDIIRKATVAHGNHKIEQEHLTHPLKKIIGIVKRKAENALYPKTVTKTTEEPTNNEPATE